ncbi:MAG: hypothetical protein K2M12_01615 [Muribaculaceae bacterium]|nr:hypothetical protein [Muribaculaceae bacterium]
MKKKFIAGMLLMAVGAVSLGTLTSCKDDAEDIRTEMNKEYVALKVELEKLKASIANCDCASKLHELEEALKNKVDAATLNDYVKLSVYNAKMLEIQQHLDKLAPLEQGTRVQDIIDIIALKAKLETFFNGTGENSLAGLNGSIKALEDIINGTEDTVGLKEWFEGIGLTPAEFQEYVKYGLYVKNHEEAINKLDELYKDGTLDVLDKEALEALNEIKDNLEGINDMYEAIFKDAEAPEDGWWTYAEVMQNIKNNAADIEQLQKDVDALLNRFNDLVTSLVLQATSNPVFGGFNTPFGLNSMVLMALYGENTTGADAFPVSGIGAECNNEAYDDIKWEDFTTTPVEAVIVDANEQGQAKLGNLWFTVNPGTVNTIDPAGFALVNSREDDPVVTLNNVAKDDETLLKFGMGRAAGNGNGLYQTEVTCDPAKLDAIKVHVEAGLAQALKDAVKNHTASDMVTLARTVVRQLQDVCDANALRYTYDAYTGKDAQGNWVKTQQKVYSEYGIAATAFKPLSFATLKGSSLGAHVPTISPIEIPRDKVNLNLGTFSVDSKNFDLNLNFGAPEFDDKGNIFTDTRVTIKTDDGQTIEGTLTIALAEDEHQLYQDIVTAIMTWVGEDGKNIDERAQKAIWVALFNDDPNNPNYDATQGIGVVADLVNQVNEMTGNIQNKLYDLIDEINSNYLGKVNTLINKYNTVAERINRILSNPNHYLQVTMLYRKAGKLGLNGHTPEVELPFGLLSTNPNQPTQFRGAGEAISLWATTYNFEILCPSYKKFVAVTNVTDANGEREDLKNAANATLAKVMNGDQNRVALNVAGAPNGAKYEIAFQAMDYSGYTSTVKCYIQVVR